jgi:exonuclease SbcD
MMSIRLMHLADLHLGAPLSYLGDRASERAKDLESAFSRALASAPEKNVDAVLISGDLFDRHNPPPDLVARVKSVFSEFAREAIPVILIPGTHDSHRYAHCIYHSEQFSGVDVLFETPGPLHKRIRNFDVYFYGFSGKPNRSAVPFRRLEGDGLHVALVHGTVADNEQWTTSPRDYSLTQEEIAHSGFHYIALGHHHNFKEFRRGAPAVYPGTLEGLKFGENGDRYLVVAEVCETGVAVEKATFNRKGLEELVIDLGREGIDCSDSLLKVIRGHSSRDSLVRITLTGSSDFLAAKDELLAGLANDFFHLQIIDQVNIYNSGLIKNIQNERTVRGIFVRKMLKKLEQAPAEKRAALELALRLTVEQFQQVNHETERTLD